VLHSTLMKLTHNSLATIIAWLSTCLLAGGVSTLFSDSSRIIWLLSGAFGLASAVGLDIAARGRERTRIDELKLVATSRFERDMRYESEERVANSAIRWAVAQLLGRLPTTPSGTSPRRFKERHPCDLDAELLMHSGTIGANNIQGTCRCNARITNINEFGFELKYSSPLPRQRVQLSIWSANREKQTLLGELLWCNPQTNGSYLAGGRFLDAIANEVIVPTTLGETVGPPLDGSD
jgi:hypothetical protein